MYKLFSSRDLDTRFSIVGTTTSLKITNILEIDTGTYQCRAENKEDSKEASTDIKVHVGSLSLIGNCNTTLI